LDPAIFGRLLLTAATLAALLYAACDNVAPARGGFCSQNSLGFLFSV